MEREKGNNDWGGRGARRLPERSREYIIAPTLLWTSAPTLLVVQQCVSTHLILSSPPPHHRAAVQITPWTTSTANSLPPAQTDSSRLSNKENAFHKNGHELRRQKSNLDGVSKAGNERISLKKTIDVRRYIYTWTSRNTGGHRLQAKPLHQLQLSRRMWRGKPGLTKRLGDAPHKLNKIHECEEDRRQ